MSRFNLSSLPPLLEIEKERCARSFATFVKKAWHVLEPGTPLAWGWALDAICQHLEAVTAGNIDRLLINVPPGCMKSLLVGVFWPAWEWGPKNRPHYRYLGTAHKQDLATRDNLKCRRLIQSEWYQSRWPIILTSDQNAKTKFENHKTGFREAMAFTSMTGSRGDRVLLDDPLSVDDANSMTALRAAELTFKEALTTRTSNDHSAIIVIMQRLHERDTSGIILADKLGYEHLCLPMRYDAKRECSTSTGFVDPRTEDGELLFPERFPEASVKRLEQTLGTYATAGQLQQLPAPRGGALFKSEWFRHYDSLPWLLYRLVFADTAQKTKEQNDFSVFQCWGYDREGNAYLLDSLRGKWEAPELLSHASAFWFKHKALNSPQMGNLRLCNVEDKVSGTGLIQQLKRLNIPVNGLKRHVDKITRAHDVAPIFEQGRVWFPPPSTPYLSDLLSELGTFPMGAHDDQVDPLMDAIAELTSASAYNIQALTE